MADVNDWLARVEGRYLNEDGVFGSQCVDVTINYVRYLFPGVPYTETIGRGNAKDLYARSNPKYFEKIQNNPNDPNQLPIAGDIIVWNAAGSNPYGHIAVCLAANSKNMTLLEQDGFIDDGVRRVGNTETVVRPGDDNADGITYRKVRSWTPNVIGWLRPKKGATVMLVNDADNEYWRWNKLFLQIRGRNASREEFRKAAVGKNWLTAMEILSDDAEADRATDYQSIGYIARRDNWEGQINSLTAQVKELDAKFTELSKTVGEKDNIISQQAKEIEGLKSQVGDNTKWETLKALLRELLGLNK